MPIVFESENGSVSDNSICPQVCSKSETDLNTRNLNTFGTATLDLRVLIQSARVQNNHPTSNIIGEIRSGVTTPRKYLHDHAKMVANVCFTSVLKPINVTEALKNDQWIQAMQEELLQFERKKVWELIPKPSNTNIIGTKWIFKNKTNEKENVIRNKARLIAQGYTQIEGVEFGENLCSCCLT